MKAVKVDAGSDELASPGSSKWDAVEAGEVSLSPTPPEYKTNEYVRAAWADKAHGVVNSVAVKAAHNGDTLAVRLEWDDTEHPESEFPDACAVAFPANGSADLGTLGSDDSPVNLWFWRADRGNEGEDVLAKGVKNLATLSREDVKASAEFNSGRWSVVLSRALSGGDGAQLSAGSSQPVAFLIWEGKNEERAGLAAYSGSWTDLEIEG
ncbi:MAG: hypothetical protein DCC49_08865 [Acidobacteria bacterium]|nr:MAG: hypothetical protein DCC49_08865 [Acidobacteriota bacterium]